MDGGLRGWPDGGGGGEMVARIGSGGSGAPVTVGVGTVDGFGSLVINGQHFDETAAQFRIDERPDQPTAASVDSIRLGMQIQFEHLSNRISQATVAAEVIGPVTSVSATGLLVLGQTVLVNADPATPTAFDGISALSDLAPGAIVEVHGQRNTAGEILATRIELRAAGSVLRVAGTVSNLANGAFRIGALTVRATQAAIVPAGQSLANGQRIAAWTDLALVNGELVARVVRIGGFAVPNNAALTIDGVITDFQSAANLRIGGIAVDASSAQFVGGAIADLRNGRSVRASGTVRLECPARHAHRVPVRVGRRAGRTQWRRDGLRRRRHRVPHTQCGGPRHPADHVRPRRREQSRRWRAGQGRGADGQWRGRGCATGVPAAARRHRARAVRDHRRAGHGRQ